MCGILGFIGKSNYPHFSYNIISSLFADSESRGKDASGFWALGDKTCFYKDAIPPSKMLTTWEWHRVQYINPRLLLCHARAATRGNPKENKNNQPFVSENYCLIHNGNVPMYDALRYNYKLEGDCDSEILLRILESKQIYDVLQTVKDGASAFAIANQKTLLLFRNEWRPLWIIDLRETLGQIFFCSTAEIWTHSSFNIGKAVSLLPNELWSFSLEENVVVKKLT